MSFKPMIDNFDLELIGGVDTGIDKAIVEYEIPFANGGILDDMGVKARRFQIRSIWRKENYELHEDFVTHAVINQINRFVHPELGIIRGRIKSVNVVHDSRLNCAEINIEFLEDVNPDVRPAYDPPLEASLEDDLNEVFEALIEVEASELVANGLDPSVEVDANKSLNKQVPTRTRASRSYLTSIGQSVTSLRGAFNAVLNPAESATGVFNYGSRLPGVIVGTCAQAVERAAQVVETGGSSPTMFVLSLRNNTARLCNAATLMKNNILVIAAGICALITGRMFAKDESKKVVLRKLENMKPGGTSFAAPRAPVVLSSNELEMALARIREMIQDGITAARRMGARAAASSLANQANTITQYINNIKVERDKIKSIDVEDATPLHLICLQHGLPYGYADRICTINKFRNPTFCEGKVKIYERHS